MRKLSVSELGAFLYCQRSWWYAKEGAISENQPEMDLGSQVHRSHARGVRQSQLLKWLALGVILLGVILLIWSLLS